MTSRSPTRIDTARAPADTSETPADEVGVAAVNRALALLDAFTPDNSTLSLAALSEKTGFYKSTILRLLQSLEAYGYVQRLAVGNYAIGPTPLRLAIVARSDMHPAEKIMPVLRDLVEATRESASFYVRSGDALRLCAYRVNSPRAILDNVQVGQTLPLNVGAAGRVLVECANLPASGKKRLAPYLPCVTRGERDAESAAMACPVFGPGGALEGAVTLSGPIGRFDGDGVAAMSPPLLDAARNLTIRFQGDPRIFDL